MVSRFDLYDFIAVIIPGIFFLWTAGATAGIPALQNSVPLSGGIAETSVLIVVGYVTGLLLQGISQQITERGLLWWWGGFPSARWLLPDDSRLTRKYKEELAVALRSKFGIELEPAPRREAPNEDAFRRNQEIFYRCYRFVEKLSDLPQTFNAQYGIFRCLLTTFVLLFTLSGCKIFSLYLLPPYREHLSQAFARFFMRVGLPKL